MTVIPGTVGITGLLAPKNAEDTHGTHEDTYGKGGFRSVADTTARDAIPADRRKTGMWVFTEDTNKVYQLEGGITNGDWVEVSFGSAAVTPEFVLTSPRTIANGDHGKALVSTVIAGLTVTLPSTLTAGTRFYIGSMGFNVTLLPNGGGTFVGPGAIQGALGLRLTDNGATLEIVYFGAPAGTPLWGIGSVQGLVYVTDGSGTLTGARYTYDGGIGREDVNESITTNRTVGPNDNRMMFETYQAGSGLGPLTAEIDQALFSLDNDEGWTATFRVGHNDDGDPVPLYVACTTSEMSVDAATFIQSLYCAEHGAFLIIRYSYAAAMRGRFTVVGGRGTWTDDLAGVHAFSGGGGGAAIDVDTTYYVDGTAGDDANDGLTWLTAKKTFGFLIFGATDAIPHEINAVLTINFRNDIRARDANGHLVLKGFYGTGRINFVGTLTAVETFTATTYQNDIATRGSRIWVRDPLKAWTPDEWRRHFVGVAPGSTLYPVHENDETTIYMALHTGLAATPACTIYSAPELLSELESDPGVKYEFGTYPSSYFGATQCKIPVSFSNLWLDEAITWLDCPVFVDCYQVNLTCVSGLSLTSSNVVNINHQGCYYNLSNYGYVLDGYSTSNFWNCAFHSLDDTSWGYNSYDHAYATLYRCTFSRQAFGVYLSHAGVVLLQEGMYFADCDVAIDFYGSTIELVHPGGVTPQLRFDTCVTAIHGTGTLMRMDSTDILGWDVDTEILFGTDDDGTFAELTAKTLNGRAGLDIVYSNLDFDINVLNEYDNTSSGLTARRYQTAIDELAARSGVNIATFAETAIDLVDDTDFTAVEPGLYVTEGIGYMLEVVPTTATGNLTVILYQDVARLVPVYTMVIDLSDADTFRSAEPFGLELETSGTLYGTAFCSGVPSSQTFDINIVVGGFQPAASPPALPSPYGDGIEDDGLGKPRVALPSDGGLQFATGKLKLKPDLTADVYPTLSAAGVAIANAVTTTTDEDIAAKKRFTAVGMDYLAAEGPPVAGTYLTGHEVLDLSGVKWRCISGGTPGTWVLVDFVADDVADYVTGTIAAGNTEVVELLTTGDVGYFQHIQIWGVVEAASDYSSEFRARIYQTSSTLGREMVWQGVGLVRQSYLTAILPAATSDVEVNDEDLFETDEACVVYEDGNRYELARISARSAGILSLDEVLVDPSSWAADSLVCSVSQFDMVPFRNTDGTPANKGRAFLQLRNDHTANDVIFYIRVMPMSIGIIGEGLS